MSHYSRLPRERRGEGIKRRRGETWSEAFKRYAESKRRNGATA